MFEHLQASVVLSLLPDMNYLVPYFGMVNFNRIVGALLVFVFLTLFFWLLRTVVLNRFKSLARLTKGTFDDIVVEIVQNIRAWVYALVSLYVALQFFTLPLWLDKITIAIFFFAIVWQGIEIISSLIDYFTTRFLEKDEDGDGETDPNSKMASHLVTLISQIVLWSIGVLFIMSNLGIEVKSLLAGLGIGGVAIAFALQGVLSDLFASFSLYFDKPFRIGDFIVIGSDSGTVEKIGIKSTRIRTLQGEELVVSNTELTSARVQNFKKMQERRVLTKFGITYETPHELVNSIPGVVERIFEALDGGRLDRVHFTSFGDSALIFEAVYHVESSSYVEYLNIQQAFNFDLMARFAEMGVEFAYPTQTIYTKSIS